MTHGSPTPEQGTGLGITDDLLCLSVGIAEIEDLTADLASALDSVAEAPQMQHRTKASFNVRH